MFSKEDIQDIYTLTPMQEGMYYLWKLDPHSTAYFQQCSFRLAGEWKEPLLRESLERLFARHDVLRTVFADGLADRLLQVVLEERSPELHYEDIAHLDEERQAAFVKAYEEQDCNRPFDLNRDVLFRLAAFRCGPGRSIFYFSYHHILFDGWCTSIVFSELFAIYRSLERHQPCRLPEAPPFKDFVRWLEKTDKAAGLAFWKERLRGFVERSSFPRRREALAPHELDDRCQECVRVPESDHQRIKALGAAAGITANAFLQTAWGFLLSRYSGCRDVVFGAVTSGRPAEVPGIESMVGLFVNTVPVRIVFDTRRSFMQIAKEVQAQAIAASAYGQCSLAQIQSCAAVKGELFDHILGFQNQPFFNRYAETAEQPSAREGYEAVDLDSMGITSYQLDVSFVPDREITTYILFNPNLYSERLMKGLGRSLVQLVKAALDAPDAPLSRLEWLPERERRRLLSDWNPAVTTPGPLPSVQRCFEAQAARTPAAVALEEGDRGVDYRDLNVRANRVAWALRDRGLGPGDSLAICLSRGIEAVVMVLGVLKSGAAHLPVDPRQPRSRVAEILGSGGVKAFIAEKADLSLAPPGVRTLDVKRLEEESSREDDPPDQGLPQHPAYLISTSGSTGKPKSAIVSQGALSGLVEALRIRLPELHPSSRLLQMANFGFDVFIEDLCRALLFGGRLVFCPDAERVSPDLLYRRLRDSGIHFFETTPALGVPLFDQMAANALALPDLRVVVLGADALPMEAYRRIRRLLPPSVRVINSYGVTECAIDSSWFEGREDYDLAQRNAPIGSPLPHTRFYVLDDDRRLLPEGVTGELFMGGIGVGSGYAGDPASTAERFVPDPFVPGATMYRTGDRARWLSDGNVEFMGRSDFQVKIRGRRIELGEIELRLKALEGIRECVVDVTEVGGGRNLVAFYTAGRDITEAELREHLLRLLPEYMVPCRFTRLDALPLNANNKLDRRALRSLGPGLDSRPAAVAPSTPEETALYEVWRRFLRAEPIGVEDDFFALGGDSITSIQIQGALREKGYEYDLPDLHRFPTIAALAQRLRQTTSDPDAEAVSGEAPLTPVQAQFFATQRTRPEHYNHSVLLQSSRGFDAEAVRQIFSYLRQHHDALRLVFKRRNGTWIQEVPAADEAFLLEVIASPAPQGEDGTLDRELARLQAGFDLDRGPLTRVALFEGREGDTLAFIAHHLLVDGVSWRVILEDLQTLFGQWENGEAFRLPAKTDSYLRWARALSAHADSRPLLREIPYWARLEETAFSPFPFDEQGEACRYRHLKSRKLEIAATARGLLDEAVHATYRTGIEDLLLAAWTQAFASALGMEHVLVSREGHGRSPLPGLRIDRTVGWFTACYPVHLDASRAADTEWTIKTVKESLRQVPSQGTGYGILRFLTRPELKGVLRFQPVPVIEFNYLGRFDEVSEPHGPVRVVGQAPDGLHPEGETGADLILTASLASDLLQVGLDFNSSRIHDSTAESLLHAFDQALSEIVDHCRGRGSREITPSDLTEKGLSMEELSAIDALVAQSE